MDEYFSRKKQASALRRRDLMGAALVSTMVPMSDDSFAGGGPLTDLTATAAVQAMVRGDIKAEAYASALLDKAKQQAGLNAFVVLEPATVLQHARDADKARAAGKAMGKLHGLPIPVKDSVSTREYATSNGTRALRAFRPKDDATMVKRLLAQGAIVMGKTNLTELSFGWTSNNGVFGAVHNPYDVQRIPGGSSGGSAAAVAAHVAPLAIAADTLGSIRVPAAMCGLAGLRPTFNRYARDGILSLTTNKFDQAGPLARSVADLALFDGVQTGDAAPLKATPLKGLRIGISPFYQAGLDADVERVTNEAYRRLREAGAVLVEADIAATLKAAFDIAGAIMLYETVPSITAFLQQQRTGLSFDQMFAQVTESMPPNEAFDAMLIKREELKKALRQHFAEQRIVALAFPAIAALPATIGEEAEVDINGTKVSFFVAYGRNTALSPVASTAALVLPAGMSAGGLPVGIEFNALPGQDRMLLSLGLSLERTLGPIPAPRT
jgi:indoleacetamide hydrolase